MNSTVLKEIIAFLFGRKYYANIVATKGTTKQEICSYIFATKEAANRIDWKSKQPYRLLLSKQLPFVLVGYISMRQ